MTKTTKNQQSNKDEIPMAYDKDDDNNNHNHKNNSDEDDNNNNDNKNSTIKQKRDSDGCSTWCGESWKHGISSGYFSSSSTKCGCSSTWCGESAKMRSEWSPNMKSDYCQDCFNGDCNGQVA
jgi:hypothetical protein